MGRPVLFTVGHSTHPIPEFLRLLTANGVEQIIDVRSVPRSRWNPQFNREGIAETLSGAGIRYVHMPGLGGLRKARPDSRNTGWEDAGFRGYADYMETGEFERSLAELILEAGQGQTAIMCAESVPWRCHRSLIADVLTARGMPVEHIFPDERREPHRMTRMARVAEGRVTYPAGQAELPFDPSGKIGETGGGGKGVE